MDSTYIPPHATILFTGTLQNVAQFLEHPFLVRSAKQHKPPFFEGPMQLAA